MKNKHLFISGSCTLLLASFSFVQAAGNLTPPGPPGPTMKTLDEIEPRTPISSLPFPISQPGSYYLVSNLTGAAGITINASDVTLDLMGFSLVGTNAGTAITVGDILNLRTNITIRNGNIRNWASGVSPNFSRNGRLEWLKAANITGTGLAAGGGSVVADCETLSCGTGITGSGLVKDSTAINNTGDGINVNGGTTVIGCTASGNAGRGIRAGDAGPSADGCTVVSCTAKSNTGIGISTGQGSTVKACTSMNNGSRGISVGHGSTVLSSSAFNNGGGGINAQTNSVVTGCTVRRNTGNGITALSSTVLGCVAVTNSLDGISVGHGSTVQNCTADENGDAGISTDGGCTVTGCAARGNQGSGIQSRFTAEAIGILHCTLIKNGGHGIIVDNGATVIGCTAYGNIFDGINVGGGLIRDCAAEANGAVGIRGGSRSTVRGCAAESNTGHGIDVSLSCLVVGNTCDGNGVGAGDGAGIHVGNRDNRIEDNNVTNNDRGIDVDLAGNLIIKNSASGNTTNYDIVAGNRAAQILVPGANFVSTDPWANFEF